MACSLSCSFQSSCFVAASRSQSQTNKNNMVNEAKDSQQLKQYYVSSSSVGESDVSNHCPPPTSNGGDDCEGHNTFITGQPPRLLTWSNVNLSVVSLFLLHSLFCRSTAYLSEPSFFATLKGRRENSKECLGDGRQRNYGNSRTLWSW